MATRKFYPGDLVCFKTNPTHRGIIEHSYKDAFKSGSHKEFSILWLDENGNPDYSSAWTYEHSLMLVDNSKRDENMQIIIKYNKTTGDGGAPIAMDPDFAEKLGYSFVHTYESATAALNAKYKNI